MLKNVLIFCALSSLEGFSYSQEENIEYVPEKKTNELYTIEGVILPPDPELRAGQFWPADTTISVDGGEYLGFVQPDGSFVVSGIPYGSYVVEVHHSDIYFKPVRVDISNTGKFRARQLSHIRPNQVLKLPYPLYMKPVQRRKYFRIREQWNIMDYVLNPMVLLMVVPLMLMLILPRLISDPETKREIENIQFPKIPNGVPDLTDMLTSFLAGNRPPEKRKKAIAGVPNKKRN